MSDTTTGGSDIWGLLLQIDQGEPLQALLALHGEEQFRADITPEIARHVGREGLVGTDIGLSGEATWRLADWSLASFRATKLLDYRPDRLPLTEVFAALARASRGRWDGVDVEAYVRDLRSE